ncbi:MAG: hypothetical protein PHV18_11160 [Lachnospiraceae bacterium]|nr:hypothetical protein [Lachnospiraceae bacterium]
MDLEYVPQRRRYHADDPPQCRRNRADDPHEIAVKRPRPDWVDELLEEMDRYDTHQMWRTLALMGVVVAAWFFR